MSNFFDELDRFYDAGDLDAVEAFILDAIVDSPDNSPEQAGFLNELAGFYRGVSRYEESERAFLESLEIFEESGMEATAQYATVLLNLAGLYRVSGEADKSIELFYSAMKKLEAAGGKDSYAYISVLNNLALAWQEKGELDRALEYAQAALDLLRAAESDTAEYDHEIAASLNNIASIRLKLGEIEAADALVSESLSIYDAMPEPDVHHAAALTTKAVVRFRSGDISGALEGFKQGLELTRRFFGENIEFAVCRRNIADVYERLGKIPEAIEELNDADRVASGILGDAHPMVVNLREKLALLRKTTQA